MFNKFGDSVAQIAQRTKSLAVEALEAIDAPEKPDDSGSPPAPVVRRASAPPDTATELVNANSDHRTLVRLIEAVAGSCDPTNINEEVSVIITQVDLVREQAFASRILTMEQKELASTGSLMGFLDSLLSTPSTSFKSDDHAASALLEALEREQEEHAKTKHRLSGELEKMKSDFTLFRKTEIEKIHSFESREKENRENFESLKQSLSAAEHENRKLQLMVEKLVAEKSALELEKDDSDKVDGAIIRSAFISLCLNMNEKSVRDGVLRVMSEMLNLSPEEKQRCGNVLEAGSQNVLANEFLKFLEEEVGPHSPN